MACKTWRLYEYGKVSNLSTVFLGKYLRWEVVSTCELCFALLGASDLLAYIYT